MEQGIACYDPEQHQALISLYGQDSRVACLCYAAQNLWFLGYPDQALEKAHQLVVLARDLSFPFSLASAFSYVGVLHEFRREAQAVKEQAEQAIALSTDQGFSVWLAAGMMLRGWALAQQGQGTEGIPQLRQELAIWRAIGARVSLPHWLLLLAESLEKGGQTEEGLSVLTQALAEVDETSYRPHEAELHRLRGELLLKTRIDGHSPTGTDEEGSAQ